VHAWFLNVVELVGCGGALWIAAADVFVLYSCRHLQDDGRVSPACLIGNTVADQTVLKVPLFLLQTASEVVLRNTLPIFLPAQTGLSYEISLI
jgi:hypothetical protein